MRHWAAVWALGGAWLAFACGSAQNGGTPAAAGGSAGSNTPVGTAAPIAIQDLCPVFTHDLCTYLMQCGGARYRDAAHCERELTCFGLPELTAAAASGAVDYDPRKVGACHERFAQSPCTFASFLFTPDIYDVLQFCPGTVTPKLKAGGSCSAHGECSAGLYCNKGANYTCPGKCQAFAQQGEACSAQDRCAEGLRCDSNQRCVPRDAPGSSCADNCSYSVSCPTDQACPTNIWCDRSENICKTGRLEGEPCGMTGTGSTASFAECAINLWCDALPSGAGTCHERSAQGAACNSVFACEKGLHCTGYVPFGAQAGLGTCQASAAVGSKCSSSADCDDGLVCSGGSCQPPGAADAACNDDGDCQTGLVCHSNRCVVARYPGDSCDAGVCTYSRCVNGTCDYHAKVGEACASGSDCATGNCVAGLCYDNSLCQPPM